MAKGIDSCVHNACVQNGKPTAGVLACGIEFEYPYGSMPVRESIIEAGGVILSELFPKDGVSGQYFRVRNRILAGLSRGTAVIQAGSKSGSLITAAYAVEEGRDVFCVPPSNILDPNMNGVIGLLRDGAILLFDHEDILGQYSNELDV